jgi:hypothetical protein
MTEAYEELLQIADRLDRLAERGKEAVIQEPLERLQQATNETGKRGAAHGSVITRMYTMKTWSHRRRVLISAGNGA